MSPAVIVTLISIYFTLFLPYTSNAFEFTEEICREYGLGSNWHCVEKQEEGEISKVTANDILNSDIQPEQKAIALNQLWETQIKRATITGAKKDISEFLNTHNLITAKGIEFSRNVQQIIENSPALFNSESYYKNAVDQQIKTSENKEILQDASSRYGLVFIYSASCHHCARQLPIILSFKKEFKFDALGITTDEHYFTGLDENIVDENVTNDPLVQAYPTILLLDKQNPAKIFISKGLTTFDKLEERIAAKIQEREVDDEK